MAEFSVEGLGDLAEEIERLGLGMDDELIGEMLDAGAEAAAEEWKAGIRRTVRTDRSTGEMLRSVGAAKGFTRKDGVPQKYVYPQGKDKKGVRNAEKAFILHYGKSGQPATRFVDEIEEKAEAGVIEAMENVFNNYLEREGN